MEFHAFNFHPQVAAGITAAGYVSPTPIHAQAIPLVLEGSDVMGLAQTGTGKTAAFVLPILERQTLLFSATMPDDIWRLAREVLRSPVTVQVNPSAGHTRSCSYDTVNRIFPLVDKNVRKILNLWMREFEVESKEKYFQT